MHPAAATLYTPIYFAKPAAEPEPLRQSIERFSPVVAGGGADWVSSLDGCEALVADLSGCDATVGAEVVYALHTRRIPVLCLRRAGASELPAIEALAHPLLTCSVYAGAAEAALAVERFLTPPAQPGRIFVVEGGDGAGKQTQTAMLRARLEGLGYPVSSIDFPHDAAMHGRLIRTLLSGAKGGIKAVNPLLFASLYSQNRFDVTPLLTHWLRRGDNVILDRYVEANFGHQASKLPAGERPALIEALSTRGCWLAEITRDHPRSPEIRRSPPLSTSGWPFPARTASPTSTCRRATRSPR